MKTVPIMETVPTMETVAAMVTVASMHKKCPMEIHHRKNILN